MIQRVIWAIQGWWKQLNCSHGPWLNDRYLVLGDTPSAHCKKCGKTYPQYRVLSRDERVDEWLIRATNGGMPVEIALKEWDKSHGESSTHSLH
jgi:hypothetical protein